MSQAERAAARARRAGLVVLQVYAKYDGPLQAKIAEKNVSCKAGCANCCRLPALASVAEMVPVVEALSKRDDWEGTLRPALELLIAEQLAAVSMVNMMEASERSAYLEKQIACIFLGKDEMCRIYNLRPSACRYHYVVSPPENCSPLLPDATVARVDLRKIEDLVAMVGAQEIGGILAGPIPAAFVFAARMLGVEFEADDIAVKRSMLPAVPTPKAR